MATKQTFDVTVSATHQETETFRVVAASAGEARALAEQKMEKKFPGRYWIEALETVEVE